MADGQAQHELIAALKDLAIELGRCPRRHEFLKHTKCTAHKLVNTFGSFTTLVQAAGIEPDAGSRLQITNAVFEKSIDKHLEEYEPRTVPNAEVLPSIAAISDIHWPFSSERVLQRFFEYVGDVKPEHVIINGDAWDMYSHSRFPRSHNVFTPREEQAKARSENERFWLTVQANSPKSVCHQLLGNHDVRPMKRVLENYPEAEDWIEQKLRELFTFEGVRTIHDPREELIFGNLAVHHGHRSQLGAHRDAMLLNSINGHTHVGGCTFRRIRGATLWELNCGLAGDPESKGLTYTPQKINNWTPGFGAVDSLGPRFIPV